MDDVLLLGNLRMQCRKALVSEEEKVRKASKKTLANVAQARTEHMISMNTYHLACTEGSALQRCSLNLGEVSITWYLRCIAFVKC